MNIPFTQTREYLSWHEAVGEKTFYKEFGSSVCASLIINLKIGKVLYVPYGPALVSPLTKGGLRGVETEILNYLKDLAKKENCVFVRLEKYDAEKISNSEADEHSALSSTFHIFSASLQTKIYPPKKSFAREGIFQPRVEWWLNLNDTEENLLNRIHKDNKYSIRRAERENIKIEIIEENLESHFSDFWNLLKETSERDGFSLYEENYYKQIFANNQTSEDIKKFLVFTKLEDKYMSVALIVIADKVANLVFAGSVSEKRELGFNHLMQWEATKHSKKMGCEIYNFGGIFENGYGKQSLQGVTNFKKRFGGFAKFHGDFVDIPIKRIRYFLYILRKMIY